MSNPSEQLNIFWDEFSKNPLARDLLKHLSTKRGAYDPSNESPHPHIQSEINGGYKAWNRLAKQLLAGPKQKEEETPNEEEFI